MKDFATKYKEADFAFPRHDISPKKKLTPEWMKSMAEAVYSAWMTGATKITYDDVARIQENRAFMRGEQDVEYYRKKFLGDAAESEAEFIRKGLMNIDWTPPAIAPKYVNIVQNMFHDTHFEVLVNALDEKSTKEKGAKKWRTWVMSRMKDELQKFNEVSGIDMFEVPDVLPETIEELEFQESIGAFRLAKEMSFEAAVVEIIQRCNLPEINKKVINDFFAYGKALIRDRVNPITQKVEVEYCDIARSIISYNNANYYDPEYTGEIKTYSLVQLMEQADLSEDEARDIARTYYTAGNYNNHFDFYDRDAGDGNWHWAKWDVNVLELEFESIDVGYKEIIEKNKFGNKAVYNVSEEKASKSKNKIDRQDVKVRYRCSWIIGTDHVFDYGYQYDVPRPTPHEAGSSYHFYDVGKPFVEIIKPHINQATMAWYRIQNTITNAVESGVIIDYDSFENMVMNKKNLKPSELIKLGKLTGVWIHKKKSINNVPNVNVNKPVEYFEGGAGRQLMENIELYKWNIAAIEEQLGMPPIASAGRQERETTLGEQQIMFASSTNAIKHFATGVKDLITGFCRNAILRIQIVAKYNEKGYQALVNSIGFEKAHVLTIGKAEAACEMGVTILPIFGAKQKEDVHQAALASMQIGKSGGVGIKLSDYIKIKRMLQAGLIRAAENWLVYSEQKEERRQIQLQRENMQLNAQAQQQAEAQKGENKMNQIAAQGQADAGVATVNAEANLAKEAIKQLAQTEAAGEANVP